MTYLEGGAIPCSVQVVTVNEEGLELIRLAAVGTTPSGQTPEGQRIIGVAFASLVGRMGDFAIYALTDSPEHLLVECSEHFGETIQYKQSLAAAIRACREMSCGRPIVTQGHLAKAA